MNLPTFRILPVASGPDDGWVVETTHDSGVVERSIVFASQEEAQAAADSWQHLDEDWAAVAPLRRSRRRDA
jgi:sorbitol-specific phosphotransferase system component IIBC